MLDLLLYRQLEYPHRKLLVTWNYLLAGSVLLCVTANKWSKYKHTSSYDTIIQLDGTTQLVVHLVSCAKLFRPCYIAQFVAL